MPRKTKVLKRIYPDEVWYTVAMLVEGEWQDGLEFDTPRAAKAHMLKLNCLGCKCAIVLHRISAVILSTKDFRL